MRERATIIRSNTVFHWNRTPQAACKPSLTAVSGIPANKVPLGQMYLQNQGSPIPVIPVTTLGSRMTKSRLPTHIDISASDVGLAKDSVILLEQIRTIDKVRLKEKMGHLDDDTMHNVNNAITVSFGLGIAQTEYTDPVATYTEINQNAVM